MDEEINFSGRERNEMNEACNSSSSLKHTLLIANKNDCHVKDENHL